MRIPDGLYPLGIILWLELIPGLVHVANITLLCLQDAGQVHLDNSDL
jgi:hypothetical protein